MATFDTTGIQQNAPGITSARPQAMPGKYSNLGGVLDVANTTIKGAVALDESLTLRDAEQQAEERLQIEMGQGRIRQDHSIQDIQ